MSQPQQQQRQDPPHPAAAAVVVSLEAVRGADVVFDHGTSQLLQRFVGRGNRPGRFRDLFAYFLFIRRLSSEAREASGWELAADDEADVVESGEQGTPAMIDRETAVKLARFVHTRIQHEDHGLFLEPVNSGSLASFRVIPHYQVVPRLADMFRRRLRPIQQQQQQQQGGQLQQPAGASAAFAGNEPAAGPIYLPPPPPPTAAVPIIIPRRDPMSVGPIIIPRRDNLQPMMASMFILPRSAAAAAEPRARSDAAAVLRQGHGLGLGTSPPSKRHRPADPPSAPSGVPPASAGAVGATGPGAGLSKGALPPPSVMALISVPVRGARAGQKTSTDAATPSTPSASASTSSSGAAPTAGVVPTESATKPSSENPPQPRTAATGRMPMSIPRRDPPPRDAPMSKLLRDVIPAEIKASAAAPQPPPAPSQRQRLKPPPATSLPQQQHQQQQQLDRTKGGGGEVTTKLRAFDVARAISAEASSVAYVYDRGVNVDAHALEGSSWDCDGNGATNTNMYSLLRSWVQDDPHRKVLGGDLLDYETIQVPVFDPKSHLPSSSTSPGAAATTVPTPSSPSVWSCLTECRKSTAQEPDQRTTTANLPDLSALSRERTQQYRQQRQAHKRALRAKDQHVLEAMKKRGIHIEPSRTVKRDM
jgi:hypothetical protein